MKLKNVLLSVMSLALVAVVAIGGTLAYLTDRDSEANVFTVGDVEIELNEDFKQGAELIPGVKVEKEARITNTGDNDAWVWMTLAVPAVLDDENVELGSANVLHWNMPGCFWYGYHDQAKYIQSGIKDGYLLEGSTGVADEDSWINTNKIVGKETIDEVEYNVYAFLYKGAIVPGEITNIGLSKVFLDENVDIDTNGQWYIVENGVATKINWNSNIDGAPLVYVSAYAIQADGFESVEAAYAAYNKQWGDNGNEYAEITVANGDDNNSPAINENNVAGVKTAGGEYNNLIVNDETTDYKDGGKYFRALYGSGIEKDLTVNNSYLEGLYAMNVTAAKDTDVKLSATNTTFDGWVSYSGWTSATFTDCTFIGEKTHSDYAEEWVMSMCRVQTYNDTTFTNCNFGENFAISNNAGCTITLNDCYKEGVKVTADNFNELLNNTELNGDYRMMASGNVTVIVDGITVTLPTA